MYNKAFTLIEIILVLAIISLIGATAFTFLSPTFEEVTCRFDVRNLQNVIKRTRFISLVSEARESFLIHGSDGFKIFTADDELIDVFYKNDDQEISSDEDIGFSNGRSADGSNKVSVTSSNSSCSATIMINEIGTVL